MRRTALPCAKPGRTRTGSVRGLVFWGLIVGAASGQLVSNAHAVSCADDFREVYVLKLDGLTSPDGAPTSGERDAWNAQGRTTLTFEWRRDLPGKIEIRGDDYKDEMFRRIALVKED